MGEILADKTVQALLKAHAVRVCDIWLLLLTLPVCSFSSAVAGPSEVAQHVILDYGL